MVNIPTSLKNLKIKVYRLGIRKAIPAHLKKFSDVGDNQVVKNTLKTNVNHLEKKIPGETTLIHIKQYNTDKQNLEKHWRKRIPDTSGLFTTTDLNTKISQVENKIPNHSKYITIQKVNKLTAENFVQD